MDDAFLVRSVECFGDLPREGDRLGDGERPARQAIRECGPFDELEDQRHDPVGLFQSIDRADVRMVERRQQSRFTREAGATLGIGMKSDGRILIATSRPSFVSRAR